MTTTTTPVLMYSTQIDLPEADRQNVVSILNQRLADCIDLHSQCKQAHWNVKGPAFIALHELFDQIAGAVNEYADLIAERVVQVGGIAEGTVGLVASRTTLEPYPVGRQTGDQHVAALASALARFGRATRLSIGEMDDLDDAVAADIMTEISRGIDKWLWFVEAHMPAPEQSAR